jgi:hypothetical protein
LFHYLGIPEPQKDWDEDKTPIQLTIPAGTEITTVRAHILNGKHRNFKFTFSLAKKFSYSYEQDVNGYRDLTPNQMEKALPLIVAEEERAKNAPSWNRQPHPVNCKGFCCYCIGDVKKWQTYGKIGTVTKKSKRTNLHIYLNGEAIENMEFEVV